MADKGQLERLRKEGVQPWNRWREENPNVEIDLSGANLNEANLDEADLIRANLNEANLDEADLSRANLNEANLDEADLIRANLIRAYFNEANLSGANLDEADLSRANLSGANLSGANLTGADLSRANLSRANLFETFLVNVDLKETRGLDSCLHLGPSTLDHRTLAISGQLPINFLRGCGLPEQFITYLPSLLDQPIQFFSCFISYSHKDKAFARRLHDTLQGRGIRCWLDEKQLRPGDDVYEQSPMAFDSGTSFFSVAQRTRFNQHHGSIRKSSPYSKRKTNSLGAAA
jgi:hypothetical protein